MPFQLEGTSAIQAAPFGSVPVKGALAADADEPVPATSVTKRTATRSVLRSELPRRFTTDLSLLVPALRLLCLRRQMTRGVSNVAGYLSSTLILGGGPKSGHGTGQRLAERAEVDAPFEDLPCWALRELRDENDMAGVLVGR